MRKTLLASALCGASLAAGSARAFTQYVPGISCEGHEWVTAASAAKLAAKYPQLKGGVLIADQTKCPQCKTYGADNFLVYSAIVGERAVDTGGLPGLPHTLGFACLNALVQDPDDLQHYHSLRGRCETGREGRNAAIEKTRGTVRALYKAAMAQSRGTIAGTVDGGATQQRTMVNAAYFLFGQAAHVFEDSFSPEHTIRDAKDPHHRIKDIKTYVCTAEAPMHRHGSIGPAPGDVVFGGNNCKSINHWTAKDNQKNKVAPMNSQAQWAVAAMQDLWTAFLEERSDIDEVLSKWMAYDPNEKLPSYQHATYAADFNACLKSQGTHRSQDARRKKCGALLAPAGGKGNLKLWWAKPGAPSLNKVYWNDSEIDKVVGAILPAHGSTCKDE